jgi:hypothetical protein
MYFSFLAVSVKRFSPVLHILELKSGEKESEKRQPARKKTKSWLKNVTCI